MGGGVVAKHIVHGGRQLESALVAVAPHGFHPLGIDHPTAKNPAGFVLQIPHPGTGRVGTVAKELAGIAAGQSAHRGNHPAVILHIVIAVEQVVFPIVLVLGGNDNLAEPLAELGPGLDAEILPGVSVAAPGGINLSQILDRFPIAFVDGGQDAGPVGAGLAAKDAVEGGGPVSGFRRFPGFPQIRLQVFDDIVPLRGFVKGGYLGHGLVEQVNQVGKSVPEKAADADGYINARPAQFVQGDDLNAGDPAAFGLPHRADAEQIHNLGNIVAVGTHRGSSPNHDAHHFGISALLLQILIEESVAQILAYGPRRRRGQGFGVDGVEVAAGGQHISHPPGGGAAGAGRDKAAIQPPQQIADFVLSTHQGRINEIGHIAQHRRYRRVGMAQQLGRYGRGLVRLKTAGPKLVIGLAAEQFQPFQHIPGAAERGFRIQFRQPVRQIAIDRLPRIIQQSRVVQAHSCGQGAAQAGYPAGVQPSQGGQQPGQLRLGRRLAQGVQAVLNLHILDFAEIAVNFQHKLAEVVRRGVNAQIPVQFGLLHHFPNLAFQQRQLGRIQGLALIMFVQQLLQLGDVAIAVGGGHGRDEVVNNRGVGAALGLGAFAGIVDDKGIKERQIVQGRLRIAGGGEANALAWQPF